MKYRIYEKINKNGKTDFTILPFSYLTICRVTPEGLEPPTNRTGICHSIQLNYGAVPVKAVQR